MPPFHIFQLRTDGSLHFVEEAETLDDARAGVQSLAELWPGKYVIYDEATGEGVSITRASSSRRGGLEV
jgi:hypothetical protein